MRPLGVAAVYVKDRKYFRRAEREAEEVRRASSLITNVVLRAAISCVAFMEVYSYASNAVI